ncbi:MAG: hypothetical protein ACRDTM_06965 [Micromonosporaceae bacterium]
MAGDVITIEHRPEHGVTIGDSSARPRPDQMRRLLDSGIDLAEPMRKTAQRIAAQSQAK